MLRKLLAAQWPKVAVSAAQRARVTIPAEFVERIYPPRAGSLVAVPWRMTLNELCARIDTFADGVISLCRATPHDVLTIRLLTQLQDSATSTAANYRAACRAQSKAAFVSKLSIALEEADEAAGWLQRMSRNRIGAGDDVERLLQEAGELSAILNASRKTATGRRRRP